MTVYTMSISRELRAYSLSRADKIEIDIKTNNKEVLDYFDIKIRELLSDDHYLDYLKQQGVNEK